MPKKKKKKAFRITVHAQKTLAYIFNFQCSLEAGRAHPDSRCPVPGILAHSTAWKRLSTPPALMPPVPQPPCHPPSTAVLRNRLSLAQSPGREESQMELGNFKKWESRHFWDSLSTPLSGKYTIIPQEPLSPLSEQLPPLLRIHWLFFCCCYLQCLYKRIIFLTFLLCSARCRFVVLVFVFVFLLPWVDNYKVLVTISSSVFPWKDTYSPLSIAVHTAPVTGDSLLPTSLSELKVMETTVFPMEWISAGGGHSTQREKSFISIGSELHSRLHVQIFLAIVILPYTQAHTKHLNPMIWEA